ncbi:MAG: N-acetyltransferase family protein [Sphingomonadaceae bacterium]
MINLRPATPNDAEAMAAIYAPYVVTNAVAFESSAPSVKDMRARIKSGDGMLPWIAAVDDENDVVLGYAYAKAFKPGPGYRFVVETAVYGIGELEGQGIRRTLYAALLATLTAQNYTQAISTLTMPNDKLIQMHEAIGFKRAGVYREVCFKNGQWIDVGLWQRDLADASVPPEDVKPFDQVGVIRG